MVTPYPEEEGRITGGVESVAKNLVNGLKKYPEIELHIVSPSKRKSGQETRNGIIIHWIKSSRLPGFIRYWTFTRIDIQKTLRKIKPDIAHFQGGAGWSIGYRKPYILTIHGITEMDILYTGGPLLQMRYRLVAYIEKIARLRAKDVILISPYVKSEIGNQLVGRCWYIENPVSDDFFRVTRELDTPRVLFVGRIPSAVLRIAGVPDAFEYEEECREKCKELGLGNSVYFIGNLNRQQLIQELGMTSCLALVSFQETAPMIVEEAMAASVPVIASNRCGLPDMVADGKSGYLVDPLDEKQISDLLCSLLIDTEKNLSFGKFGREIATQRFHMDQVTKMTIDLYKSVYSSQGVNIRQ